MLVLGIESTCDETSIAVVEDGKIIHSNVIASQVDLHRQFGGVVPELACRRHVEALIPVLEEALGNFSLSDIDLIGVAKGPGLIGAVMIGLNAAKALAWSLGIPFVGVNHIEAHLYAGMMTEEVPMPAIGVVVSGGHTSLLRINALGDYKLLGQTVDDAIGEAFDKVAKLLGLPYPGGPEVEKLALEGDASRHSFNAGNVKGHPLNFSFSGLKTAVRYATDKGKPADIAAAFQEAALSDIVKKTLKAAENEGCKHIVLGGGVTCNNRLKVLFEEANDTLVYHFPPPPLRLDNAAMIAGLAYHKFDGKGDALDLEASSTIHF